MKLLLEIGYKNNKENYILREAVRIIAQDSKGSIPLLYVSKYNYHKLPGEGIDEGEGKLEALNREMLEETGCSIVVSGEVGKIIEYRDGKQFGFESSLKQISYCYYENITNKSENFALTESEIAEGYQLQWHTLSDAISLLENDLPKNLEGKFIQERDLKFLKQARRID